MSKKLFVYLAIAFVIILGIVYASYDIYKALAPEALCVDECKKDGCDNHTAFSCEKDINNCYYKKLKEIEMGVCRVECLTSDDCNESLKCMDNECKAPECGDGRCDKDAGENCRECPEDCVVESGEICCLGKIEEGNCCSDSDCKKEHEICDENKCVIGPYCGDGSCDENENCETCRKDCRPSESEVCCSGEIKTGDCCRDSQCEEGYDCKKNKCTAAT